MKYSYVAYDPDGKKIKGVVEADNETAAIYYMRNQDMSPFPSVPIRRKPVTSGKLRSWNPKSTI